MSEDAARAGLPVNRIEALTDGVFAIAMTLLVFGVELPHTTDSLGARLWSLWPKLSTYVLSFVMLGILWIGHHYQLNHLRRTSRGLIWINLWFLLAITFLPFGASVLGTEYHNAAAVVLYAGTIMVAGLALLLHWVYATGRPELVVEDLDPEVSRALRTRIITGVVICGLSIGIAFVDTRIALAVLIALPVGYFTGSRIDKRVAPKR